MQVTETSSEGLKRKLKVVVGADELGERFTAHETVRKAHSTVRTSIRRSSETARLAAPEGERTGGNSGRHDGSRWQIRRKGDRHPGARRIGRHEDIFQVTSTT